MAMMLTSRARRDAYFAGRGFRTLRFWNNEIDQNLNGVVETIWNALHDSAPTDADPSHKAE
jgi:very-short-patch-repair endonuclease